MVGDLETLATSAPAPSPQLTFKQEMAKAAKDYPTSLKSYFKGLAPALIVSGTSQALGQWAASHYGFDSAAQQTLAAYIFGYLPGYTTAFVTEYRRHRDKYPRFFSKQMLEYVGTFLAADYVADALLFSPEFITLNVWLTNTTSIHPFVRSQMAWYGAGALWISGMAGLHPLTRRINQAINKGVRNAYASVRKGLRQVGSGSGNPAD